MNEYLLTSKFQPTGDQPEAILALHKAIEAGNREQVLLGVTGSGKTFTVAHLIAKLNRPTLIISHNKTLAAQLYQEFRDFFPKNAVSYFVSYYDYYQPEAYIPQSGTFIEKETEINDEIDKLRLAATTNILTRKDTIVVASVSSIYNIGSPREYGHFVLELKPGIVISRESIMLRLIQLQYTRESGSFTRGTFRVRGDVIDIFPAYEDTAIRLSLSLTSVLSITRIDPIDIETIDTLQSIVIFPAKHYMTNPENHKEVFKKIDKDLEIEVKALQNKGKIVEAQRLRQRVEYDIEMIGEMGYVNGIENYSRYFDGRSPGDPPFSLLDYFKEAGEQRKSDWLLIVDESHITIPQIRGMYNGDRSRKQTLVDFGFRLRACLDNRPLNFGEFLYRIPDTVYVSATPDEWELSRAKDASTGGNGVVEQLVRPTGLVDPLVSIHPTEGQIPSLLLEIEKRVQKKERAIITTLTKRMAEELSEYIQNKGIKVNYLHSDIETLDRNEILRDFRLGLYDVIIGINLLREGLDLPEVSLIAILDADKEGFLRSKTSLIQIMGRAARHVHGSVILYADGVTQSMKGAMDEVNRRRKIQETYNTVHNIQPRSIIKPIRDQLIDRKDTSRETNALTILENMRPHDMDAMTPDDKKKFISKLAREMKSASKLLLFERAMAIRDAITAIEKGEWKN
ncbi:excinuclease ABC subunit UvrB [Candidatus Gottesmanbacteria bacterium]|nr:excinuclease ABC subunit UvrB [Candidatus Gottesmanbacteria bacterium]